MHCEFPNNIKRIFFSHMRPSTAKTQKLRPSDKKDVRFVNKTETDEAYNFFPFCFDQNSRIRTRKFYDTDKDVYC